MNNEDTVVCIYHADPDGMCSAYITSLVYPKVAFIAYNYEGDVSFLYRIPDGTKTFVLDTSFPNDVLKKLNSKVDLVWIDHHDTAIEDSLKDPAVSIINGVRKLGISGCELTWEYFFPGKEMPPVVKAIGRYDVWDKTYFPDVKIFQLYLGTKKLFINPSNMKTWEELFEIRDISPYVEQYRTTFEFMKFQDEITAKTICYEGYLGPYKCIVANRNRIGSDFFESVVKPEHDLLVSWVVTKKGFIKYTVWANREDIHIGRYLAEITEGTSFRGGGHQAIGSFRFNKILFPNKNLLIAVPKEGDK